MRLVKRCQTCGNWIPEYGVRSGSFTEDWTGYGWCMAFSLAETIHGVCDGGEFDTQIGYDDVNKGMWLTYYLNSCDPCDGRWVEVND